MAVTVSNYAARQINFNGNTIDWGSWSTSLLSFRAGSYNSTTKYVAQLRFRLSAPCSSITLQLTSYSSQYQGTTYWAVSSNEYDESLAKASGIAGHSYDASVLHNGAYQSKTITFYGSFSADVDYYLYGFSYAAGSTWSAVTFYVFHNTYPTKITSATEIQGAVYIDNGSGFEAYQVYIDNGSGWDLYLPYIDNGNGWDLQG